MFFHFLLRVEMKPQCSVYHFNLPFAGVPAICAPALRISGMDPDSIQEERRPFVAEAVVALPLPVEYSFSFADADLGAVNGTSRGYCQEKPVEAARVGDDFQQGSERRWMLLVLDLLQEIRCLGGRANEVLPGPTARCSEYFTAGSSTINSRSHARVFSRPRPLYYGTYLLRNY